MTELIDSFTQVHWGATPTGKAVFKDFQSMAPATESDLPANVLNIGEPLHRPQGGDEIPWWGTTQKRALQSVGTGGEDLIRNFNSFVYDAAAAGNDWYRENTGGADEMITHVLKAVTGRWNPETNEWDKPYPVDADISWLEFLKVGGVDKQDPTAAEHLIKNITQFALPFVQVMNGLNKIAPFAALSKGGSFWSRVAGMSTQGMIAALPVDIAFFDSAEINMVELAKEFGFEPELLSFLEADPNDTEASVRLENRVRAAITLLPLGAVAEVGLRSVAGAAAWLFVRGARGLRNARNMDMAAIEHEGWFNLGGGVEFSPARGRTRSVDGLEDVPTDIIKKVSDRMGRGEPPPPTTLVPGRSTKAEAAYWRDLFGNKANREEILDEMPSATLDPDGNLSIDQRDLDALQNFLDVSISRDGAAAVPPRMRDGRYINQWIEHIDDARPPPSPPTPARETALRPDDVATGKPVKFHYSRNMEQAPDRGSRFGQDVEPAGRYMVSVSLKDKARGRMVYGTIDSPSVEYGMQEFNNPLVMDFGGGYGDASNWKNALSAEYGGLKGEQLSDAVRADGYDGIITIKDDARGRYVSEIVDLKGKAPSLDEPGVPRGPGLMEAVASRMVRNKPYEDLIERLSPAERTEVIDEAETQLLEKGEIIDAAGQAHAVPSWAKERLQRTLRRPETTGRPSNQGIILESEGGTDTLGLPTTENWIKRVEEQLNPEEITAARKWYREIRGVFVEIFGDKEADRAMTGWLASNQNVDPATAMTNMLKVREDFRAVAPARGRKQAGLSEKKLRQLFSSDKIEEGLGVKLLDFLDSAVGAETRTAMGGSKLGSEPFVIDIHSLRDMGYVDWPQYQYLRERHGQAALDEAGVVLDVPVSYQLNKKWYENNVPAAERERIAALRGDEAKGQKVAAVREVLGITDTETKTLVGGRPTLVANELAAQAGAYMRTSGQISEPIYERAAAHGRSLTKELNAANWQPGTLTTTEAQAIGWTAQARRTGDRGIDTRGAIERSTGRVDFGDGSPLAQEFPDFGAMSYESKDAVTRAAAKKALEIAERVTGTQIAARLYGPGGWMEVTPSAHADVVATSEAMAAFGDVIGHVTQQTEVWVTKLRKNGKDAYTDVVSAELNTPEKIQAFWDVFRVFAGDDAGGFSPLGTAGSLSGIRLLNSKEVVDAAAPEGARPVGKKYMEAWHLKMQGYLSQSAEEMGIRLSYDIGGADISIRSNDWRKFPDGESYLQRLRERYGPEIQRTLRDIDGPEYREVLKRAIDEEQAKVGAAARTAERKVEDEKPGLVETAIGRMGMGPRPGSRRAQAGVIGEFPAPDWSGKSPGWKARGSKELGWVEIGDRAGTAGADTGTVSYAVEPTPGEYLDLWEEARDLDADLQPESFGLTVAAPGELRAVLDTSADKLYLFPATQALHSDLINFIGIDEAYAVLGNVRDDKISWFLNDPKAFKGKMPEANFEHINEYLYDAATLERLYQQGGQIEDMSPPGGRPLSSASPRRARKRDAPADTQQLEFILDSADMSKTA
jgi:hypothetical protein